MLDCPVAPREVAGKELKVGIARGSGDLRRQASQAFQGSWNVQRLSLGPGNERHAAW